MPDRIALAIAVMLTSTVAGAAPMITSVTPNNAPVAGGTHVIVKGSGFAACPICSPPTPPAVFFGGTAALSVQLIDGDTIDAVAPAHPPVTVDVTVYQFDGIETLPNAITFSGAATDAFEPILAPIFSPAIHGAFGSVFQTVLRTSNRSDQDSVSVYGNDLSCLALPLAFNRSNVADPTVIPPAVEELDLTTECSTWPARLFFVSPASAHLLTMNDRVVDTSRAALSLGTEIPIVRSAQMTSDRIVLLGVPINPKFRNTLRIYNMAGAEQTVFVTIAGQSHIVHLQPGRTVYEPAYGVFSDFPSPAEVPSGAVRVTIDSVLGANGPVAPPPIWAFITVTNNETQDITTITPD